ncbi:nuclear factor of activated T-cells 5 isoform X2 [Bombina bombina]|uniref:nuclear factor of activated T-cells 5 isoform X2 n=1 Tax=Bombina bombina TaxID=8345 RepID=UPI00235AD260|nr:nuclear factor of activated T-cells 5 isoform X2 [Bombina bombina]
MPSDFISLLSADLDLESPKSLYSRESVYDLLPKELQLPPSRETSVAPMSQTSGGEAGSPPPAVVAADASSSSSSTMGGARSSFITTSSPTIYSTSLTDTKAMQLENCSSAVGVSKPRVSEQLLNSNAGQPQQSMPLRWTVLNISPPPEDLLDNSRMSCQDEGGGLDSEHSCSMWTEDSTSNFSNMSAHSYNDNTEVPRKSRKRNTKQRPGAKRRDSNMDIFDADSAKAPHYVLSQLTSDSKGNCQTGNGALENQKVVKKGSLLCEQYPSKSEGKELKIVVQPETQHRARYLTEGSRGSVKDRTQQGFPTVKLEGHNESVVLQVFVGNDSGRVKPHGFYQACRVTGRNTTPCKEVDIEGTTVIEVMLDPNNMMTLAVDCVGILKLRNADVEARIGLAGSKKKSTRARLVFRVNITRKDGSVLTLQTTSSPILCTQPAGVPEILKKSLHICSVKGEEELFLIGKNFLKGAKVIFQENISDDTSWKAEAEIDMELFHQNHLVVKVPPYHDQHITTPVSVVIFIVTNAGRSHEVQPFTYTPDPSIPVNLLVKKEVPSPTQSCTFEESMKAPNPSGGNLEQANLLPSSRGSPIKSSSIIKNEDAPMELLTGEQRSSPAYKASKVVASGQQNPENPTSSGSFSPSVSHLTPDSDHQTAVEVQMFNTEPLSTIQTQDISQTTSSFQAVTPSNQCQSSDSIMQQGSQFQAMDGQSIDTVQSDRAIVTLSQMTEAAQQSQQPTMQEQAQTLQQISSNMFSSSNSVNQLQNTMHQLQTGNFQSSVSGSSSDVNLVHVLEAQQQLSCVLFPGQGTSENKQPSVGQVQEQLNAGIFQPVNSIQNTANTGLYNTSESVLSRSENVLSGRSDNILQQTDNALSNQQQQAMETTAALVMEMQQSIHQTQGSIQSELFQPQNSSSGGIQSPVYQQAPHLISGLSANEEIQMQCEMFPNTNVSGNEGNTGQQQVSAPGSHMFQPSTSVENDSAAAQAEQMQQFQTIVQMQHSGESQAQVNLFSSAEDMIGVQTGGNQQQGNGLFQQAGDMISLQPGSFMQQSSHSHSPLYHNQNTIGDNQNMSQDSQRSLFHTNNPMIQHQNSTPQEQLHSPLYHAQTTMSVMQGSSVPAEQSPPNLFLAQGAMSSLQSSSVPQDKQLSFFAGQNSLTQIQTASSAEQQAAFQQQAQLSHMQSSMISQEPQQQSSQNMFPTQNQQTNSIFQATQSMVGIQNSSTQHDQTQTLLYNAQNTMANMGSQEQQQNMMYSSSQEQSMATQEQQNQALFHSQKMEFQAQSPISSHHEQQQSPMYHNSPQLQMVQASPTSPEQVTLFMSSASMTALQNSISQQELQQASIYSQTMQGSSPPSQQQAAMFHSTGGAMNQMQNPPASPQSSGMFLFGIQNNCSQLMSSAPGSLQEQMMALSQTGQNQGDAQSVSTLLSQQMTETSSITSDQNMEKITDLLESLQNQGNSISGSF